MATTIDNARVFDGAVVTDATSVRMYGGIIADCGPTSVAVPGDEVVDAAGGMLLPGLLDTHVHLLPGALRQALTFGVTTVCDLFSKPEQWQPAAAEAARTSQVADVRSSSVGATAPGGHPSMMYAPFQTVAGPEDAPGFVADRAAEGAAFLKVIYDSPQQQGPFTWPSLDAATVAALVAEAHDRGLLVVAHVTSPQAAADVVEAGVGVLAHVPVAPLDEELVGLLRDRDVAVIATLATIENVAGAPGAELAGDQDLGRRIGPAWGQVLRASASRWRPPDPPDPAGALANVGRLAAAGVRVLAGTDAPNPGTLHGASLHRELELLVKAGLTPAQALAAATQTAARAFGLHDRGLVAPGLRADLALVDGDPTVDITATRRITGVWRGGVRCDLAGYVGSAEESLGLRAFHAQTDRVVTAARALWPRDATDPGRDRAQEGKGSDAP